MDKTESDLVARYKLETDFFQDHIRHTRYITNVKIRNKEYKEDWSNCGELGKGGFGVVHKQIQKATGSYRAVKTIDKRAHKNFDYSRELLVMAILAKRRSSFVEILGWFEEPETLYIAMEYLEEGDLTKYVGTPLPQESVQIITNQVLEGLEVMHEEGMAHRDIKPANIFVVSMSPVWIKLGDFGISKRIRVQDTTTFHTQVSTPMYSAPEVLGLNSNSETSAYTNSVDIWSLGCVVFELLAGTALFSSESQTYLYFFRKWPFPEDKLKELSPPIDDVGISLLKSMLTVEPEDRPTAPRALVHEWLIRPKSEGEQSRDDQGEVVRGRCGSAQGKKNENILATHRKPKKKRREVNLVAPGDPKSASSGVSLESNEGSQRGSDPTTSEPSLNAAVTTPQDAATVEGLWALIGSLEPEPMPHSSRAAHSIATEEAGEEPISRSPQTCPPELPDAVPQCQTPAVEIDSNQPLGQIGEREEAKVAQPLTPFKIFIPGETVMSGGTLVLAGTLILSRVVGGTLMLAGTLILFGIIGGYRIPVRSPFSDGTQAANIRAQAGPRKRYQRQEGEPRGNRRTDSTSGKAG